MTKTYALSIRPPWAWLIATGWKDIENRDWPTSYRGRFLIHASKTYEGSESIRKILTPDQWQRFEAEGPRMARGALIGEATIYDCVKASRSPWFFGPYGFAIRDARLYAEPIPYRGQLGFFDVQMNGKGREMTRA